MPLTPERQAKMLQKQASTPEALKRDESVDYFEGWFSVTLNTRDGVPVLSTCEGDPSIAEGEKGAPYCKYSELGKGVIAAWKKMPSVCPYVEIDICEVMPEHFHGLLYLKPGNKRHLGSLIGGFMSGCSHAYWDELGIEWRKSNQAQKEAKARGDVAYAKLNPDRDRDHSRSLIGPALFVHGYNDMEPVTPEEIETKRRYIRDQARRRLIKGNNHECFAIHRNKHSRNWTQERILSAIRKDPGFARNAEKRAEAEMKMRTRLAFEALPFGEGPGRGLTLAYLGHAPIMANARKLPLVCHRRDAARFEEQRLAVLEKARQGWTIVSAFISPKEREIREQLMRELLPFIEIMDNGFAERYKPVGRAFYAVAENRLVQISPWEYEYQKDGTLISREMCLIMNELARVISGREDDWWK